VMLICINTAREALFPLITISDPATRRMFLDDIEEDVQLNLHIGHSNHMDRHIFDGYLGHIFILPIKNCWKAKEMLDFHIYAIILMNNYSDYLKPDTIQLFSDNKVKIIIFSFHISGIFQIFDFVLFGLFRQAKKQRSKEAKKQRSKEAKKRS
jgi:hypothetical protein